MRFLSLFLSLSLSLPTILFFFFFFNDTAPTEIYTLSLHDALPILPGCPRVASRRLAAFLIFLPSMTMTARSEEHTSELQSRFDLVCRLLLEKKNNTRPSTCPPSARTAPAARPRYVRCRPHLPPAAT